jgi:hypothetical protein
MISSRGGRIAESISEATLFEPLAAVASFPFKAEVKFTLGLEAHRLFPAEILVFLRVIPGGLFLSGGHDRFPESLKVV